MQPRVLAWPGLGVLVSAENGGEKGYSAGIEKHTLPVCVRVKQYNNCFTTTIVLHLGITNKQHH